MTDAAFDFWQKWGRALGDAEFACAWVALGVVAGSTVKSPGKEGHVGLIERDPTADTADTRLEIAKSALGDAWSMSRAEGGRLRWSLPSPDATVDADGRFELARIEPASWARAWKDVAAVIRVPPRLRVNATPEQEPATACYRLLLEAVPPPHAVSLVMDAPYGQLAIEWPLRFAALTGNDAHLVVTQMLAQWPSSRLACGVPIDRGNANCDVLLHQGNAQSMLLALHDLPFRCKANLVALIGASDPDPELAPRLREIAQITCASGIVQQPSTDPQKLASAWNRVVEEVSHNVTMDRALHVGARDGVAGDVVIRLTDRLAEHDLHSIADRLTARVRGLPAGSLLDISRLNAGWVRSATPQVETSMVRGTEAMPSAADSATIEFDAGRLSFDAESHGASELAMLAIAVNDAVEPPAAEAQRAKRYLQQQSFVDAPGGYVEAKHGFVAGRKSRVQVRIGPPEATWQGLSEAFPEERLPPGKQWRLTVWLIEPTQLHEPLRGILTLPREGASQPCELLFSPRQVGRFEGRLTILHRGRVLQTAILRAGVVEADSPPDKEAAPRLTEVIPVRHRLGDLDRRRQFDLAFVTNHTVTGEPRGVALSTDVAWIADVTRSLAAARDINTALSRVAASVVDYADGIDGEDGRALIVELARQGAWLQLYLVGTQLRAAGNRPDIAEHEYIQIVSTRSDATVPFEFIYDYAAPKKEATPCPHWRDGVAQGKCLSSCETGNSKYVCPMGFWGLRKVIERHQLSPEHAAAGREFLLQSEPGRDSDELSLGKTALLAHSDRVSDAALKPVVSFLSTRLGAAPLEPTSWSAWALMMGQQKPRFLLALTHADGAGANITLEIRGDKISTIEIEPSHLQPAGEVTRPLVALLGCDVAGTASDYCEHITVFRDRGAAIVIGTIATVFGGHAASVAKLLADELLARGGPPQRLGEAIRALKRRALLDGLLMPLCLVAYGDADWRIVE